MPRYRLRLLAANAILRWEIPVRGTVGSFEARPKSSPTASSIAVQLGSILILSHAGRQDSISVRSTDRHVKICGSGDHKERHPTRLAFIARSEWEIASAGQA